MRKIFYRTPVNNQNDRLRASGRKFVAAKRVLVERENLRSTLWFLRESALVERKTVFRSRKGQGQRKTLR